MSASGSAVKNWDHGQKAIGTSAAFLVTNTNTPCSQGVLVKAAAGNAGVVYVGKSDVTANSAVATDGYPLAAGEEVFIPTDNAATVFAIASQAAQGVFFAYA